MPLNKEIGYVLSVDPGSNACGVSLFLDGTFVAGSVLQSRSPRDPYSKRLQDLLPQLESFLAKYVGDAEINTVVCEGVRSRIVQTVLGAVLSNARIRANISPKGSFVESTSWKSWAKKHGAAGPLAEIKGVKALKETGWNAVEGMSDDEADAVLVYLTWRDR